MRKQFSDIMTQAERGIRDPRPALTTTTLLEVRRVMAAHYDITPTTQIPDDVGRDWAWAFVIFRPVVGYENYRVGSDGSLWSRSGPATESGRSWRKLNPGKVVKGYLHHSFHREGKHVWAYIHVEILKAFIGLRPHGMDACHNDGNPANNNLRNLRWDTRKGNHSDMIVHGTRRWGSKLRWAKLRESDIPTIRKLKSEGYKQKEIAMVFGVARATIGDILTGKYWKHVE